MSDFVNKLESNAFNLLVKGAFDGIKLLWDEATGGDVGGDEAAINLAVEDAARAGLAAGALKVQELIGLAQVRMTNDIMAIAARGQKLLASFVPLANPSVPPLDLPPIEWDTPDGKEPT